MKETHKLKACLAVLAALLICACSSRSSSTAPIKQKAEEVKPNPEKEYLFTTQGSKKITASVFDASQKYGEGKKLIIFSPFVAKTDGNFYMAALEALWNIYGKRRGLFQLNDAQTEYISKMEGNAIFWYISNPRQRFYSLPIKDSGTGEVGAIVVWISELTASDKMVVRQRSIPANIQSAKEPSRDEATEKIVPDEAERIEDTNVVKTSKGTPRMVELENSKNKKSRYW